MRLGYLRTADFAMKFSRTEGISGSRGLYVAKPCQDAGHTPLALLLQNGILVRYFHL